MQQAGFVVPKIGLDSLGLKNLGNVHWNLSVPALYEEAIRRREGQVADGGAFVVRTGVHTGRSPNDKFFVEDSRNQGAASTGARPTSRSRRNATARSTTACWATPSAASCSRATAGPAPIRRTASACASSPRPPGTTSLPATCSCGRGARSSRASSPTSPSSTCRASRPIRRSTARRRTAPILVNFTDRVVAICGTWYAGEIKKSVFTILNYLLPDKNVLPMHASANIGPKGDVAIFFGLSRHRQDDLVGRSVAHPDRRRRARLGRDQPLQLRGRLLRQGDQAQPRGRARDLRHHRTLRHGAGERRDRSGDRRGSTSTTAGIPRTRAPAIRSNSSPTPRRRASPARRRTSSC